MSSRKPLRVISLEDDPELKGVFDFDEDEFSGLAIDSQQLVSQVEANLDSLRLKLTTFDTLIHSSSATSIRAQKSIANVRSETIRIVKRTAQSLRRISPRSVSTSKINELQHSFNVCSSKNVLVEN